MDNATTSTNPSSAATGSATDPTPSIGRTLRPREPVLAPSARAGQVKPRGGKGKKPARRANSVRHRDADTDSAPAGLRGGSATRPPSQEHDFPTVAHPIFAVSAAPQVEDISHEALTWWVNLRLEYEEIMRARCASSGEDLKSVMRSIRNSFDDSFLETLCETKWDKQKEDLADEFIWDWIMTTVQSFKNNVLPDIDGLFRGQLVMSTTKSDVDARVMDYFHLCDTIVKNNGLTALFAQEEGVKKKCKVPLSCLPEELKKRVQNEVDFRLPTAKSRVSVLFQIVSEKALEINREDSALKRNKRRPMQQAAKLAAVWT